jgi:hypothetical protein
MDELAVLTERRPHADPPTPAELAAARARLTDQIRLADRIQRGRRPVRTARRRIAVGPVSPTHVVNAAQVLHRAAEQAERQPDVAPRPGQFVYSLFSGALGARHPGRPVRERRPDEVLRPGA